MTDIEAPRELAPSTPKRFKTAYAYAFLFVAFLSVLAVGLARIPQVANAGADSCRALRLCSPSPLKPMQPLATGWLAGGSTFTSAAAPQMKQYQAENPDYKVCLHPGRQFDRSGAFHSNVQYRFEGTFEADPNWVGLFDFGPHTPHCK
ncbi:hypothetical protein [Bradyrhizobium sp. S69]|uniref:hypothetical protein n=1 Tax=Bradyrhizobium sp. S69 TaxID=1641856 RepID=UPI00131DBE6D|nr:hypothetical protein [Bradyrhizobium sp. S69]